MKRMAVLLTILGSLLAAGAVSENWLHDYTRNLSAQLTELSGSAESGKMIRSEISALLSEWQEAQARYGMWTTENHLDPLETHLKNAEMYASLPPDEEHLKQLRVELLSAADAAEELWEKERVSLQNIF